MRARVLCQFQMGRKEGKVGANTQHLKVHTLASLPSPVNPPRPWQTKSQKTGPEHMAPHRSPQIDSSLSSRNKETPNSLPSGSRNNQSPLAELDSLS